LTTAPDAPDAPGEAPPASPGRGEPNGVDQFLASSFGFAVAFGRAWGLQMFAPRRAAAVLEADYEAGHPRYVSAFSFIMVGALLIGFGASTPMDFTDLPGWLAQSAEVAVKALEFDEDGYFVLVTAALQAVLVYLGARLGGLLGPAEHHASLTRLLTFVLTAAQLAVIANTVVVAVAVTVMPHGRSAEVVAWLSLGYLVFVAPMIMLGRWLLTTHEGRWLRRRLLGLPLYLFATYVVMLVAQVQLYELFQGLNTAKVSLATQGPAKPGGRYVVPMVAWLDASDAADLCEPALCPPDLPEPVAVVPDTEVWENLEEHAAVARGCVNTEFSRSWVPPEWEVPITVSVDAAELVRAARPEGSGEPARPEDLELPGWSLCCQTAPTHCYSNFEWPGVAAAP